MSTICVYPASIACQIGPIWENTFDSSQLDYKNGNFNLLIENEEEVDD